MLPVAKLLSINLMEGFQCFLWMMIENKKIILCIYPATRSLFDLPRSVGRIKEETRLQEEISARRVMILVLVVNHGSSQ